MMELHHTQGTHTHTTSPAATPWAQKHTTLCPGGANAIAPKYAARLPPQPPHDNTHENIVKKSQHVTQNSSPTPTPSCVEKVHMRQVVGWAYQC